MGKENHILQQVYSPAEIEVQVEQMAAKIKLRYHGEPLIVICVLKGAFMLFSDLLKHLDLDIKVDFVRLSSYGDSSSSSRQIKMTKDVECDLVGQHVLLVEDIVDTAYSMNFLLHDFRKRGVKSLGLACLLDKPERREFSVDIDFVGFQGAEGFLVGYGLDFAGNYRELPGIYKLDFVPEK